MPFFRATKIVERRGEREREFMEETDDDTTVN